MSGKFNPAAKKKGDALEDLVLEFFKDLRKQLRQHNLPCLHLKSPDYPGQGIHNIDFILVFRNSQKIRYYFYTDPKNHKQTMKAPCDIRAKIYEKFYDSENSDFDEEEENSVKTGLIVGNFRMPKHEINNLLESNIHYLETGELGTYVKKNPPEFILTPEEKKDYDIMLRCRLMEFIATHSKGVFELFSSNYSLEIEDQNNFLITDENDKSTHYNIENFGNEHFSQVNSENLIDFFILKKGIHGGITLISPWKGFSNNSEISVRNASHGTTLYKTQWGRKRK